MIGGTEPEVPADKAHTIEVMNHTCAFLNRPTAGQLDQLAQSTSSAAPDTQTVGFFNLVNPGYDTTSTLVYSYLFGRRYYVSSSLIEIILILFK